MQARFKDKGSEIASEQLSQVFFAFSVFCLHIVSFAAVLFILLDFLWKSIVNYCHYCLMYWTNSTVGVQSKVFYCV